MNRDRVCLAINRSFASRSEGAQARCVALSSTGHAIAQRLKPARHTLRKCSRALLASECSTALITAASFSRPDNASRLVDSDVLRDRDRSPARASHDHWPSQTLRWAFRRAYFQAMPDPRAAPHDAGAIRPVFRMQISAECLNETCAKVSAVGEGLAAVGDAGVAVGAAIDGVGDVAVVA